jgi:hypothetical protein
MTCKDCGAPAAKPHYVRCDKCYRAESSQTAATEAHITRLRWRQATPDAYYHDKFDESGDVRPDWCFNKWVLDRVAGWPKTPSVLAA